MKKLIFPVLIVVIVTCSVKSQDIHDSIFTSNNEILVVDVKEVTENSVKYSFPNEDIMNNIFKNSIIKIRFKSGRIQTFTESSSFNTLNSAADYEKVTITQVESEVKGLFKLDEVSSKAKGTTTLSNMNKVKERAYKKLKIECALLGGNIIYLTSQQVEGNKFGGYYQSGTSTFTNLSGIAYTSRVPNFEDFKKILKSNSQFNYSRCESLGNNSTDLDVDNGTNEKIDISDYISDNGFIYVNVKIGKTENTKFKVVYFSENQITLMYKDKRRIYNLVLAR